MPRTAVRKSAIDVKAAVAMLLSDLSSLSVPAIATAVAGILAPVIAAVAGVDVTAAEIAGDIALFGMVAGVLQKLTVVKAAPVVPVPPAPPIPPAK